MTYSSVVDRVWDVTMEGLLPMAAHLLAVWLVGVAVVSWGAGSRGLALIGVLPALLLALFVLDALLPSADDSSVSGVIWVGYILTMLIAQPLALLILGLAALRPGHRSRIAELA